MSGIPAAPAKNPVVSIQVQTTRLTGAGVEVVSYKEREATHWSLYLRLSDGTAQWYTDIPVLTGDPSRTWGDAVIMAAKLSMLHSAFIEEIR